RLHLTSIRFPYTTLFRSVEFLEHYTGDWTLRLLLTTLAMTPLRKLTRLNEPIRVRRVLGLWAYAFLCLHFSIYLVFDLGFSVVRSEEHTSELQSPDHLVC